MLRRLYDWTMRQAEGPRALPALAGISFAESSFFPIPPDVVMGPMILAQPHRAWFISTVTVVASILGGFFGYWIGAALFDTWGRGLLEFYGAGDQFEEFKGFYDRNGVLAVLLAGSFTPLPFKVVTVASGAVGMNFIDFLWSSVLARSLRFYIVAGLLWKYGEPIREFIEKRLALVATVFTILVIGGFFAIKHLAGSA